VAPEFEQATARLLTGLRSLSSVVVAGPSSSVTIPGLMTDEVVGALAAHAQVIKVAVNSSKDYDSGLHRAKSLSANFRPGDLATRTFRTPLVSRQRRQEFRQYFRERVELAVALAWPGIDNSWIGEFVHVARQAGARTVVLVVTHPSSGQGATSIARELADADLVLVGDILGATLLSAALGTKRPVIEVHRALSLTGRDVGNEHKRLTTFLPKDDEQSLLSVLTAFDAIPTDWIDNYDLRVMMRYSGRAVLDRVAASYHSGHVQLIGEDFSSLDMHQIATDSSAMSVADPAFDSRAYATAVDAGVATVVLAGDMVTDVGRGYVGGLLADINRPTSVYVAHNHALRLSELRFPSPAAWFELAARLDAEISDTSDDVNEFASS
jgi:hypothetical protein